MLNSKAAFRIMSAIIAIAFVRRRLFSKGGEYDNLLDNLDEKLELPTNIISNLSDDLLPYLKAIQVNGYESNKRRKVFVMGNTGKKSKIR